MARTIIWYRGKDLRVADHLPMTEARKDGEVVPLFVLDPYFFAEDRARKIRNRIQFLLESLAALAKNLEHLGSRLVVVAGRSTDIVPALARTWKVDRVVGQRWTEPFARERDRRVAAALSVPFDLFEGETLLAPGSLRTQSGSPYSVFTPFSRAVRGRVAEFGAPLPAPRALPPLPRGVKAKESAIPTPEDLGFEPNRHLLPGGEAAARARMKRFFDARAGDYATARDRLDAEGTSRLSQDLKFGLLSPRTVWAAAERARTRSDARSLDAFENELVWREFAYSTLWDRPEVLTKPFRSDFEGFPWRRDEAGWRAWVQGTTGYPVVDAAARQLLRDGFVHNRARMISASFLTKHLMIDYRRGEEHYMHLLTDGDWASNNLGWQWVAGSGCDAQPYFRVFNPVTQGKKFDAEGDYVREYVPELARMPSRFIHHPWDASDAVLSKAGVRLGVDYPRPIVDHAEARQRYLALAGTHLGKGG